LPHATAQQGDENEQRIFELTNQERAAQGLQPLRWDRSLAAAAAVHVDKMKDEKTLSHQYPGEPDLKDRAAQAGLHFRAVTENIAVDRKPEAIEKQWMNSAPDQQDILNPQMNAIGIAVVRKDGYLYAVEDLAYAAESLTKEQVGQRVGDQLRELKIDPSVPHEIGEEACAMQDGMPDSASQAGQPKAVVRYQKWDLNKLPDEAAEQLGGGKFTKAAVGACNSGGPFTSYRVAIVLY
jgi:hypothetical protein